MIVGSLTMNAAAAIALVLALEAGVVRANNQYIPLMVSLSNHEQKRSSFDRLRTSGVLKRQTHHG